MIMRSYRWLTSLILIAFLAQLAPVQAQQQVAPIAVDDFRLPNETAVTLDRALHHNGRLYHITYFTTDSNYTDPHPHFIDRISPAYTERHQITGLLVTADGEPVQDEATLRDVLTRYRAAYYLYDNPITDPIDLIGSYPYDDLNSDISRIINNPIFLDQFIPGLFESREDQVAAALRAMLTAQRGGTPHLQDYQDSLAQGIQNGQHLVTAADQTLEAARFSNNKQIRDITKEIKAIFKKWQPVTEQGTSYIEISNKRVELFNALDVLDLGVKLIWIAQLQEDQAAWLNHYTTFAAGSAALDEDQLRATATILAEVENDAVQRGNLIIEFVEDQTVDLGIKLTTKKLAEEWVSFAWKKYGKRIKGHRAAGAASAVSLGFTIGNLLYGLDDLHTHFRIAHRANELRQTFQNGRFALRQQATTDTTQPYDGDLAARYQAAYMLEAVAAAQTYRSYADGVDATVKEGLLSLINPINWFKGKEWREAAAGLRDTANQFETDADNVLGHPQFVDHAVALAYFAPSAKNCLVTHNDGVTHHTTDDTTHTVCVDLTNPNIHIQTVMANDFDYVNSPDDQRETIPSMVTRLPHTPHNPLVAVNADYFGVGHGPEGFTVVNGRRLDGSHSSDNDGNEVNRVSQAISRANKVSIGFRSASEVSDQRHLQTRFYNATGGGPTLVRNGRLVFDPCPQEGFSNEDECRRANQTAVGVSQDGQTYIILVAAAKTGQEMGRLLLQRGAYHGIKLDGGGSSQLWYRGETLVASSRPVANALVVFAEPLPRHDAALIEQSEFPILKPGEPFTLTFTLRNIGLHPWEASLPYTLRHVDGTSLNLNPAAPLPNTVPYNGDITWQFEGMAPSQLGAHRTQWQMFYQAADGTDHPFGEQVAYLITVVPTDAPQNLIDALREIISQFQEEVTQNLNEYIEDLQRRLADRIQEEILKQIPPELRCLLGLSTIAFGMVLFTGRKRRHTNRTL